MTKPFALRAALPLFLVWSVLAADTALDRYVRKPDPSYHYDVVNTIHGDGYTLYVVNMISQTWRKPDEVNQPVWKHWLTIVKPDNVTGNTGYLFLNGGSVTDKVPDRANPAYVELAMATHTVAADLQGVPNEPLTFAEDGEEVAPEDGIIAYTWVKFLKTGDETWPLRLPMTKCCRPRHGYRLRHRQRAEVRSLRWVQARLDHLDHGRRR